MCIRDRYLCMFIAKLSMCVSVTDSGATHSKAGELLQTAGDLFKEQLAKTIAVRTAKNNAVGLSLAVNLYIERPEVISMYEDTDEGYNLTIQQTDDGKVSKRNIYAKLLFRQVLKEILFKKIMSLCCNL